MPSPAKKRKLNENARSSQPRGLEYFFSKQKQNGGSSGSVTPQVVEDGDVTATTSQGSTLISDEEFARKLQAQWDEEDQRQQQQQQQQVLPVLSIASLEDGELGELGEPVKPPNMDSSVKSSHFAPLKDNGNATTVTQLPKNGTLSLQSVSTVEDEMTASLPLDQSPLVFEPAKYTAKLQQSWAAEGGGAPYALLTRCFVLVSGTQSRIKIVDTLVNCLRLLIEGDPGSLLPAVWLATNSISPPYVSRELGLGGSAISKALKQVCGLDGRSLRTLFHKHGDPGDVAYEAKKKQAFTLRRPRPLTIQGVYQALCKVTDSQGPGSVEAKQRIVDRLLQDARGGDESRFIVRTLCQHLRIGAVKTTMLIALSRAFLLSRPPGAEFSTRSVAELTRLKKEELAEVHGRSEEIVKACFARRPNYDDLVEAMLEMGISEALLQRCGLELHVPLRPMLGAITRHLGEMLARLQGRPFACEFKYDGQRAQVHCDTAGRVSIFSRHLERMTDKYPDLVSLVPQIRGAGVGSFILEGEVVAVDRQTGALRSFQTLANRARKDVAVGSITVDVCLFAFDLMLLNGQPLLDRPFRERRELLRSLFVEMPHHFRCVESMDATSEDGDAISAFFKRATDIKCEGIMVKILDNLPASEGSAEVARVVVPVVAKAKKKKGKGIVRKTNGADANDDETDVETKTGGRRKALLATYEPDRRLDSWLKVKKDYGSTHETLDLIPVAAWHGMGRKAKWWSPILMAVRNEETGSLEAVTKCMSGFTDAFYKANRAFYSVEEADESDSDSDDNDDEEDGNGEKAEKKAKSNTRTQKPSFVDYSGPAPDIWFEPQEVWEMAFADITLSPTYTAAIGLVSDERGLSLRFPRFLRQRDDKGIDEASTSDFLATLYRKQEKPSEEDPKEEED
ncbi:DNA ligase [Grosmannia clavigera kw1407]|uniref:DNA ligase n=1 Tax=Grosmannia clavigera (strain kw1407 / UAMH 11150) TaxID=655863 RepID=F0XLA7_GROCL|nr:DNA ligase [Grosmannia clavigera kw1407]EFX01337.1 DNA ligase [Grosmannia clavigera kw1407]